MQLSVRTGASLVAVTSAILANPAYGQSDDITLASLDTPTIIVTGQKVEQDLQDVTASVDVTTAEEIAREPVSDLYDIINRVPNVNPSFGGLGFSIRGVDQRGIAGTGATLTIYVDDSPLGNQTTFFGPLDSWDLGQVEVFRGPQSTNFGRNSLAGAIYVRTQDPTYEWDVRARGEIGNNGIRQAAVAFGGPLVEDSLAFRFAANYRETDGFIFNTFLNEQADATELQNYRVKLLMEPDENLRFVFTTSYTENFAGEDNVNPITGLQADGTFDAGDVAREVSYDFPGREGTETLIQSINATWDITSSFQVQSISTYQDTDYVRQEDFDATPAPVAALDRTGRDEAFSQEVRLKYQSDRLSAVAGFYYFGNQDNFTDSFTVPGSILGIPLPGLLIGRVSSIDSETDNYAFFADGEFALTDTIDLLFGIRYDNEETSQIAVSDTFLVAGVIPPQFGFLNALLTTDVQETAAEFDAWLPKGGIRWSPSEDVSLSFVVQRAYRSGGSEISILDGALNEFDPEFLTNYELSLRSTALDGRLRFNANAYYSDWSDQQVFVPFDQFPTFGRTQNAGESTLYGFEVDASFQVTPEFELYGGLGFSHTEFDDFSNGNFDPMLPESPSNQPNFAGNRFPFAPRWSANMGVTYNSDFGLFGGVDANYQSDVYQQNENFVANFHGARWLVNARIGYEFVEGVELSAYVRNLFDEEYFTSLNVVTPGDEFSRLGAERTVAVRLDLDF